MTAPASTPLADWRNESDYPADDAPDLQWAWEFIRRQPEYRDFWASTHPEFAAFYERENGTAAPNHIDGWPECPAHTLLKRWGFLPLPNPADRRPPKVLCGVQIAAVNRTDSIGRCAGHPRPAARAEVARSLGLSPADQIVAVRPGQAAILLDLDKPLDEQLDEIRKRDNLRQEFRDVRRRRDALRKHLRILDANEAGASRKEAAAWLLGLQGEPARAFRQALSAAKSWRDSRWRLLVPTIGALITHAPSDCLP